MELRELSEKDKYEVIAVYLLLLFSVILMFSPVLLVSVVALVAFLFLPFAVSSLKKQAERENGDSEKSLYIISHAKYVNRTMIVMMLIAVVTSLIGSIYIGVTVEPTGMEACFDTVISGSLMDSAAIDYRALSDALQPCMDDFIEANKWNLYASVSIALVFPVLYLLIRSIVGIRMAFQGKPVQPKEKKL